MPHQFQSHQLYAVLQYSDWSLQNSAERPQGIHLIWGTGYLKSHKQLSTSTCTFISFLNILKYCWKTYSFQNIYRQVYIFHLQKINHDIMIKNDHINFNVSLISFILSLNLLPLFVFWNRFQKSNETCFIVPVLYYTSHLFKYLLYVTLNILQKKNIS